MKKPPQVFAWWVLMLPWLPALVFEQMNWLALGLYEMVVTMGLLLRASQIAFREGLDRGTVMTQTLVRQMTEQGFDAGVRAFNEALHAELAGKRNKLVH